MTKPLLPDALWERIKPLWPPERPKPKGGRPRVSDRAALTGTGFVLKTGCPWEYLPRELGCGSGMTCWWRLRDWHHAGVWKNMKNIWKVLSDELGLAGQIDLVNLRNRQLLRAGTFWGAKTGPNPTD